MTRHDQQLEIYDAESLLGQEILPCWSIKCLALMIGWVYVGRASHLMYGLESNDAQGRKVQQSLKKTEEQKPR